MTFRWKLADDDGGQPALFSDDELVERHVGKGEFRGMEFLHVNARTIINEVPGASRMPFRWTINAYRGCSHACSYCADGETPVLMADGSTKPLGDIAVGDQVVGTVGSARQRLRVATPVLDRWETLKTAYRVRLGDGRELVTSADHRFLTDGGWRHVARGWCGTILRPTDRAVTSDGLEEMAYRSGTPFPRDVGAGIASVEPLGVDVPMYDITTGTGDFIANGVVSHNCFARPTHDYLGLNIGEDFEKRIVVKVNAVERLRAELRSPKWRGEHIAMGTNTDPYQRCEGKYHLTRGIIAALAERENPFSILTKSTLILRDLDLLSAAAKRTDVRVNFSIGTLDEDVWRLTEPGTPHPRKRVEAVAKLNEAGVECGVLVAPILPNLSDRPEQVREVVQACVEAGAVSVSSIYLHLRPGVRGHFMDWLGEKRPDLVDDYEKRYRRSYLPKSEQHELGAQVRDAIADAGGLHERRLPGRAVARATQPKRTASPDPPAEQLSF